MIFFTSSWDDGSPSDLRLSELLLKYDQRATFFIPLENRKQAVINSSQIHEISRFFEIGGHTLHHRYLTEIPDKEAELEIRQCKKELEEIISYPVNGFCFPGGKFTKLHLSFAEQAGYRYARTTNMFKLNSGPFLMDTTLQAFNHPRHIYLSHLVKRGYFTELLQNSISIISSSRWDRLLSEILNKQIRTDSMQKILTVHLWGHSYELQANNSWGQLEQFLKILKSYHIPSKTNFEIFRLKYYDQEVING